MNFITITQTQNTFVATGRIYANANAMRAMRLKINSPQSTSIELPSLQYSNPSQERVEGRHMPSAHISELFARQPTASAKHIIQKSSLVRTFVVGAELANAQFTSLTRHDKVVLSVSCQAV